jgi:hypothetical protein
MPYSRFAWGNETNRFPTQIGQFAFETVNTIGEDRLVRANVNLTVQAALLAEQQTRQSTLKKMFSMKKVVFDNVIDVEGDLFSTNVPSKILQAQSFVSSGGNLVVSNNGTSTQIDTATMAYIVNLTEKLATYSNSTTVTVSAIAAINPVTLGVASKNEFDVYINGQYIDKFVYTWTPDDMSTQTIVFDTGALGYTIETADVIIVKGRWQ